MVMMCRPCSALMASIMLAWVVDFPDPVGPVNSTSPCGTYARSPTTPGRISSSYDGMCVGMARRATATEPRWRNALPRMRPLSPH